MATRSRQIDFASGVLVFPGGKVEKGDLDPRFTALSRQPAKSVTEHGLQVAAIREVYEECGVLLADFAGEETRPLDARHLRTLEARRQKIREGTLGFADFIEQERLLLACGELHVFAHWITPEMMPKRYDTIFYLAAMPAGQHAIHDGQELVNSIWITPRTAVEDAAAGRRSLIFPTLRNLDKLARHRTVAEAVNRSTEEPVITVTPWMERRADGNYLCIPKNAGYRVHEQLMPARGLG